MPRHRAQRLAGSPVRRVRVLAAIISRPAGHARRAAGPAWWGPLGATVHGQLAAIGARLRHSRRRMLSRAARGLLVSPWFAAGAGFVIATTAFIVAPRAELRFSHSNAINVTQCTERGCRQTIPQGAVPLAEPSDQIVPSVPAAVAYRVISQQGGMFKLEITLTGSQAARDWHLYFAIPGADITSVVGARWQAAGTDGGTAHGSITGNGPTASVSASAGQSGSQDDGGQVAITFFVTGSGSPAGLTGCAYNGAQCHFSPSS
jgi:hypothetical protein